MALSWNESVDLCAVGVHVSHASINDELGFIPEGDCPMVDARGGLFSIWVDYVPAEGGRVNRVACVYNLAMSEPPEHDDLAPHKSHRVSVERTLEELVGSAMPLHMVKCDLQDLLCIDV